MPRSRLNLDHDGTYVPTYPNSCGNGFIGPCLMRRLNKGTVAVCFGEVIGLIVADGSQECLGYDQYGGFIDGTRMKPGKAWGLGFGLAGGLQVSDAHSKQDLTGPFKYAGHSIGDDGVGLDSTCLGGGGTNVVDEAASAGASAGFVAGTSDTAVTGYYFT